MLTTIELGGLLVVIVIALATLGDGLGDPGRALDFKPGASVPGGSSAVRRSRSTP